MFMLLYPACKEATAARVLSIESQRFSKQLRCSSSAKAMKYSAAPYA
jgi:hypothetical protein